MDFNIAPVAGVTAVRPGMKSSLVMAALFSEPIQVQESREWSRMSKLRRENYLKRKKYILETDQMKNNIDFA